VTSFTELDKKLAKAVSLIEAVKGDGNISVKEKDLLTSAMILLTKTQLEFLRRERKEGKGKEVV